MLNGKISSQSISNFLKNLFIGIHYGDVVLDLAFCALLMCGRWMTWIMDCLRPGQFSVEYCLG